MELTPKTEHFKPKINIERVSSFIEERLKKLKIDTCSEFGSFLDDDLRIPTPKDGVCDLVVKQKDEIYKKTDKRPEISESLIALILNEFIGKDYIIARSSKYDDYENGVDYVLIKKESGDIICGIDGILGRGSDDGFLKKMPKIENKMLKGGFKLDHAPLLENGKINKTVSMKGLPAFFLGLSKDDFDLISEKISQGDENLRSKKSEEIVSKMSESLMDQYSHLLNFLEDKNKRSYFSLKDKFKNLESLIESMNSNFEKNV